MSKAVVNRQQAEKIAELALAHGHVTIEYDYDWSLIISYGNVRRAVLYTTGKIEVDLVRV